MGFKQPSAEKNPQANVLTGMPTTVTILDIDLISESANSRGAGVKQIEPRSSGSQPESAQHPSPSI